MFNHNHLFHVNRPKQLFQNRFRSNFYENEGRPYDERPAEAGDNVQIVVEKYFIIQGYVSNDRFDYNTLIPVVRKHMLAFDEKLKEVTAVTAVKKSAVSERTWHRQLHKASGS